MSKITGEIALYDCDKYDYYASVFSGLVAGMIDVLFVGAPGQSSLGNFTDEQTDNVVKKFASMCGWDPKKGKEDSIASAIGFLEKKFPVNYDMPYANFKEHGFTMAAKNHHIKSLAHCPDPIGLFFSIIDQFAGTATFISNGQIISVRTETQELQGGNFIAKLFCGFANWIGHIMSDVAGSSGGRGNSGRGSGVPIPFFEVFLLFDFGSFQVGKDRQTFAEVMTRVFQDGYDLRFGAAMAIPVLLNELFLRAFWAIKRHFYHELEWKKCIPSLKYKSLNKMLLIGNAGLCLVDTIDAGIRSGGNIVTFILRLNIVAWGRLIYLIFKYLTLSRAKIEYERKHIENMRIIKEIETRTEELRLELKQFLEEQQLIIDNNLKIATLAIAADDVDTTGAALNNIAQLFGAELQFTNFKEFDEFMLNPDTVFEL